MFQVHAAGEAAFAAALAQIPGLAQPPPALPSPPLIENTLLENPIPLVAGLLALAVLSGCLLNRAGRSRHAVAAGAGLVAVAAGVYTVARAVETRREAVAAATRALVDAVARVNEPAMRGLLAESARLHISARVPEMPAPSGGLDREQIIDQVAATLRKHPLREHRAAQIAAAITGPNSAKSQCRVRVVIEGMNYANNSWWVIVWRLDEDGQWRAVSVTPWSIDGLGSIAP